MMMTNAQPDFNFSETLLEGMVPGDHLPLMEHFYTIQGEGFHQGKAAYFIRLGGCDVGCVWCDVKESWDASKHTVRSVEEIAAAAKNYPSGICVITGGEPTMYNLFPLTASLHQAEKKTHLETSAAYPVTGEWDWICISPKKFKAPLPENLKLADELKVVVFNKSDFGWAEEFAILVSPRCKLFLQPEWSKEKEMTPLIVEYVKTNPQWEISLQVHKYLNLP
ncbi:MAG: 7-carboxy-7-deazaguanine synthase QueE [Chitinophagales bacterium]